MIEKKTVLLSQSVKGHQIRFLGHGLRSLQGDLISNYALYHPTHGKPRPRLRCKVLFHEYAAKLIKPENAPFPHEIRTLAKDREAWKRMEVDGWHSWDPP